MSTTENNKTTKPSETNSEFDISLLEYNLSLSPEKRLENHDQALALYMELLEARKQLHAKS